MSTFSKHKGKPMKKYKKLYYCILNEGAEYYIVDKDKIIDDNFMVCGTSDTKHAFDDKTIKQIIEQTIKAHKKSI